MRQILTIEACAKVNLFLDITGRRADGYHMLNTVMQQISLSDRLTITAEGQGSEIRLDCTTPAFPCDARNLICRAANAFFAALGESWSLRIMVEKQIPMQAGLGGGSADAAATLRGLNRMFDRPFSDARLAEIGLTLGADVPFCLFGGTMRAEGIGERLTPLPPMPDCTMVVAMGEEVMSTPGAYRALDDLYHAFATRAPRIADYAALCGAISAGSLAAVAGGMYNLFEDVVLPVFPALAARMALMQRFGAAGVRMSGSGCAVFGLFATEQAARAAQEALTLTGAQVWLCRPVRVE